MGRLLVHADFNRDWNINGDPDRYGVRIGGSGAIQDLANAGIRLAEGMLLTLYNEDGNERMELDVTVVFDRAAGYWVGDGDLDGYRFVPITSQSWSKHFRCVDCGAPFDAFDALWDSPAPCCPICGLSCKAPIAPPEDWIDSRK